MEAEWRIRNYISSLSVDTLSALRLYHVELLRFNQKLNLISTYTEKNADILHFLDSIKACEYIYGDLGGIKEIYDFGSGNGFPGLIMAILYPDIQANLVEVDERKAEYLKHMLARLELKNAKVFQTRAENIAATQKTVIISRAFANLARILLMANKIVPVGSVVYSLKGPDWFSELTALPNQISSTWNNDMGFEYDLPENLGARVVIKSVKTA